MLQNHQLIPKQFSPEQQSKILSIAKTEKRLKLGMIYSKITISTKT
jgi:hypothetical protein